MIEKFPIPLKINDVLYHSCDIDAPTPGVLADTKKVADTGDRFNSTLVFLAGCIKSIVSETAEISERIQLKSALRKLPFRSGEVIALKSILQVHDDDGIEGIYPCPRCNHRVVSQIVSENGETISDTRDFIRNLDIEYMQDYEETFDIQLTKPTYIINGKTGEPMVDMKTNLQIGMSALKMKHPTLGHCIEAQAKQGSSDDMRLQYRIYVEAITEIDGMEIDRPYRDKYGMMLFEKIPDIKDIGEISKRVHTYGIASKVKKICPSCGKEWMARVNTSNFFEFAPPIM
jgi:hypothetical protein